MILLDATDKSLEIDLDAAVTTSQLDFYASYIDVTHLNTLVAGEESNDGTSNDTTAVTIVTSPGVAITRQIKFISISNTDTAEAAVTVSLNNNSTLRQIIKRTLQPGDTLQYTDGEGWEIITGAFIGQELGQARENGTSAVSVYAASNPTKITTIFVCNNTGSATTFSLYLDGNGTTYDATTALFVDAPLAANTTIEINTVLWMSAGNLAYAPGTANAVTITVHGEVKQ